MAGLPAHDVFVSYAEADAAWVEGYLLPTLGLPKEHVRTHHNFDPGGRIIDASARAVDRSHHTLLVLSPAFAADRWATLIKDLAAFVNAESERGRLVPLRYQPAELGLELRSLVTLDFTNPANWDPEPAQLRTVLGQPAPIATPIPCPYPDLRLFAERDRERLFERETEAKVLMAHLRQHPFLAVIGRSGSGKSSLAIAELVYPMDHPFTQKVRKNLASLNC